MPIGAFLTVGHCTVLVGLFRGTYALVLAERIANPQSEVLECLSHLSWHREQLPRRIMQKGRCSTKATLELRFNHMTCSISLATVNKKASPPMKWLMSIISPFLNGFSRGY